MKNKTSLPKGFVATSLSQSLRDFFSIEIEMVRGSKQESFYNALIAAWHYLGYHQGTGEQLKYIIRGDGHLLACIGFGAAAFKSAARDRHIGWDKIARERTVIDYEITMIDSNVPLYVLFDSCYASAKLIKYCRNRRWHVICALKNNRKFRKSGAIQSDQLRQITRRIRKKDFIKTKVKSSDDLSILYWVKAQRGFLNKFKDEAASLFQNCTTTTKDRISSCVRTCR